MRTLLALLLAANLIFLALAQGWLEPVASLSSAHEREPQRLAAQIDPQALRVLPVSAASAALAASAGGAVGEARAACLKVGPLGTPQLDAAEAALAQAPPAGLRWSRLPADGAAQWLVVEGSLDEAGLRAQLVPMLPEGAGFAPCP